MTIIDKDTCSNYELEKDKTKQNLQKLQPEISKECCINELKIILQYGKIIIKFTNIYKTNWNYYFIPTTKYKNKYKTMQIIIQKAI